MTIAAEIRKEITKALSRQEKMGKGRIRKLIAKLENRCSSLEHQLAQQARTIASLEKVLKSASAGAARQGRPSAVIAVSPRAANKRSRAVNFSAEKLLELRNRLGLSASDMGLLLGVSGQSIYLWEKERATPRASALETIAAVNKLSKRAALKRVEALRS